TRSRGFRLGLTVVSGRAVPPAPVLRRSGVASVRPGPHPSARSPCKSAGRVLCGETATDDLQPSRTDHPPEQPDPERAREQEADEREEVDPEHEWPVLREDPDQARADQASDDDQRDDEPVEGDSDLVHELVEALAHEADLDLAVTE